jgi:UDP-N-acetylmuramoyl-tripeptide--D-alanyl-D-alanine ligase
MKATLSQLASENCTGQKTVVLGAMGELGDKAQAYHEALADDIIASGATTIILIGDEMAHTAAKLQKNADSSLAQNTKISHVKNASEALTGVAKNIGDGDILLIKGSNYLGLSKVVTALVSGEY